MNLGALTSIDFQWQFIMDRTERNAKMSKKYDNLRYATDVKSLGIQGMREQPGYYLPRAVRR